MSTKLPWEKEYIVYHMKSFSYHKGFTSLTSARRSATCSNRNAGVEVYNILPHDEFWAKSKQIHEKFMSHIAG